MTEQHDDEQVPFVRSLLDTKTADIIAAIVTLVCVAGAAVVVVAALLGVWPW